LNKAYRYDISFTYQYGNNTYISDIANIRYLTVEYNYEASRLPKTNFVVADENDPITIEYVQAD